MVVCGVGFWCVLVGLELGLVGWFSESEGLVAQCGVLGGFGIWEGGEVK